MEKNSYNELMVSYISHGPLFISFAETIKKRIASGEWAVGSFLPSIRKLEEEYRYSRNTVTSTIRVLVNEKIIAREGSARQGYRIVSAPDDIVTADTGTCQEAVKFVLPFNYWNYVGSMLIESIETVFSRNHVSFLFSNHKNDIHEEARILGRIESGSHTLLKSLLLMPSLSYDYPHMEQLNKIQELIPVILVDRYIDGLDAHFIGMNNHRVGRESVQLLIERGHRKIAFFGGYGRISTIWERLQGAQSAAHRAGIPIPSDWIVMEPFLFKTADSIDRSGKILAEQFLEYSDRPTAIVCGSDKLAAGLYRALDRFGLRIPDDVSLIACDDDRIQRSSLPKIITSWAYPFESMAREIFELYTALDEDPTRPVRSIELPPIFLEGETVS